jgi:hypothetical protein
MRLPWFVWALYALLMVLTIGFWAGAGYLVWVGILALS